MLVVKNWPASAGKWKRYRFDLWIGKISWRKAWQPTPVFLPEESLDRGAWQAAVHRVHTELDMTEAAKQQQPMWETQLDP